MVKDLILDRIRYQHFKPWVRLKRFWIHIVDGSTAWCFLGVMHWVGLKEGRTLTFSLSLDTAE